MCWLFFTHMLKIMQADIQLLVFQDTAFYLSPYAVKAQTLSVKLPDARIESYTRVDNTENVGSEIKYGPYENLPPFSYSPIVVHCESNRPFAVAEELVRDIEISHWGNVQMTEHYKFVHGCAQSKGEFSRLDYQARPHVRDQYAIGVLLQSCHQELILSIIETKLVIFQHLTYGVILRRQN